MRANEFISEKLIDEGESSAATQYNSELGCLLGFLNPEANTKNFLEVLADNKSKLINPGLVIQQATDNQKLAKKGLNAWVKRGAWIKDKIGYSGKVGWDGVGQGNAGAVADVMFDSKTHSGISIKEKTGITLANTTPVVLGFEYKGDIFQSYHGKEWETWKLKIVEAVLNLANDGRVHPTPDTKAGRAKAKLGGGDKIRAIQFNKQAHTDKAGNEYPAGTYTIWYGKGTSESGWHRKPFKKEEIKKLAKEGNSLVQRVFGDWYQAELIKNPTVISWQKALFKKFGETAIKTLNNTFAKKPEVLNKLLQMNEKKSYFYANDTKLYEVPAGKKAVKLQIVGDIVPAEADGSSQKFFVNVQNTAEGDIDPSKYATLELYIRYANGLFASNPTVRIQKLTNPQYLLWKLIE
jgi:hypothetical protein